jgi:hypothetical protein
LENRSYHYNIGFPLNDKRIIFNKTQLFSTILDLTIVWHYLYMKGGNNNMDNKQIKNAKRAVYRALQVGKIERAPCWVCAAEYGLVQQHEDYSRPLEVKWICKECLAKESEQLDYDDETKQLIKKVAENGKHNWETYHYPVAETKKGQNDEQ